jgi:hypothetical protein
MSTVNPGLLGMGETIRPKERCELTKAKGWLSKEGVDAETGGFAV